ncbi:ABC-type sugar transport system, periplasmic component [Longilinea arvoryzae]|uniref:ABC-type sugar transport system, periplasmic component n=1 Tax=Longilinea arvoryzae TaxID=360412 RepID=A0A0K8MZE1_9CHLR|nr:extracellular solute-binding protein [Longilinea arvoryzae]GAP16002.1 ABC-type sugar transport system, periplasmic component [Longilinea arvoryzae]
MYHETFTCGRCGKPVSKGAISCPHCGVYFSGTRRVQQSAPSPGSTKLSKGCISMLIIGAVVICIAGASLLFKKQGSTQPTRQPTGIVMEKEAVEVTASGLMLPVTAQPQRAATAEIGENLYERALAGEFSGRKVSMLAQASVNEAEDPFAQAIQTFREQTNIQVDLELSADFGETYANRIRTDEQSGGLADVIVLNEYGTLKDLASEGVFLDVRDLLDERLLRERYDAAWLELAMLPGSSGEIMAGVWHTYESGRVVFYAKDDFEAAGYSIPGSWNDLIALSDQIVAGGGTPWCVGLEYTDRTEWTTTFWLEDILLRTRPRRVYEAMAAGALDFESAEIQDALKILSTLWNHEGYVYHDPDATPETFWSDRIVAPLFEEPPGCWLFADWSYSASSFPVSAVYGENFDWFLLPPIDESYGQPLIIWGNLAAVTSARPEVGALVDYFTHAESMKPWLRTGFYSLSPHKDAPLDGYADAFARSLAERQGEATELIADATQMTEEAREHLHDQLDAYIATALLVASGPPPVERRGNIMDLIAEGSISVQATGRGIDELDLDIENLIDELLDVEIPAGTYFVAAAGGEQNMVVRHSQVVQVEPNDLLSTILDAACAEMEDDVPGSDTGFSLQRSGSNALSMLMPVLEAAGVDYDVEQAAIWIVTNNADYSDLGTLVSGWGYARMILEEQAAQAMRLVDEAGLNITTYRIWADREMIADGASAELARWLRER